jgi:hypothetical protein
MMMKIIANGVKQPIRMIGFICGSYEKVPSAPIHNALKYLSTWFKSSNGAISSCNAQPKQKSDISCVTFDGVYILANDDRAKTYRLLVGGSISLVHIGVIVSALPRTEINCG